MDTNLFNSVQQQIDHNSFQPVISKGEYLKNLKSECLYKQNALKTAENLIQEYSHQNQELKLQVLRLKQKIQNYEEKMQILNHQIQSQQIPNVKSYQQELFKSSFKLSQVLQKYSQLQEKYHQLEKQLINLKNYKKQQEQKSHKQKNTLKNQIDKKFSNSLKTPVNKSTHQQTNPSTGKKSFTKTKNLKMLHIKDFESSSEEEINLMNLQQISQDSNKQSQLSSNELFLRSQAIKRSVYNSGEVNLRQKKKHDVDYKTKDNEKQELFKKLRILQWRIKQKDEEIMLMLRRNKEIEGKYQLLKQIIQKNKQGQGSEEEIPIKNNQNQKNKRNTSQRSKPSQISLKPPTHQQLQANNSHSSKATNKNVIRLNTSFNNSTDISILKNLHNYKLN